jgi:hypothetical protein
MVEEQAKGNFISWRGAQSKRERQEGARGSGPFQGSPVASLPPTRDHTLQVRTS